MSLEVWTLINRKSTVIPSSPMVLFCDGEGSGGEEKVRGQKRKIFVGEIPVVESPTPLEPACQISRWLGACKTAYFMALGALGRSQRSELFQNYFEVFGVCEDFVIF